MQQTLSLESQHAISTRPQNNEENEDEDYDLNDWLLMSCYFFPSLNPASIYEYICIASTLLLAMCGYI